MQRNLSGGRCLNVIWDCESLTSKQTLILHYLASQMDFNSDFREERWASLTIIAAKTKISRSMVQRELNALESAGYLVRTRRFAGNEKVPTAYAITDKIFDEAGRVTMTLPRVTETPPRVTMTLPRVTTTLGVGSPRPIELPHIAPSEIPSRAPSFLRAKSRDEKEAAEILSSLVSFREFTPIDSVRACGKFLLKKHGIDALRTLQQKAAAEAMLGKINFNQTEIDRILTDGL